MDPSAAVSDMSVALAAATAVWQPRAPPAPEPSPKQVKLVVGEGEDAEDAEDAAAAEAAAPPAAADDGDAAASSSDEDFSLSLSRMEEDEDGPGPTAPPLTANERQPPPARPLPREAADRAEKEGSLAKVGVLKSLMLPTRTAVISSTHLPGSAVGEGSVLCVETGGASGLPRRLVVGEVSEVFGPVTAPLYIVRLPVIAGEAGAGGGDGDEIEIDAPAPKPAPVDHFETAASPGAAFLLSQTNLPVYSVPSLSSSLSTAAVEAASGRGCDASDLNDEEAPADYSDDEKESEGKRKKKGKRKEGQAAPPPPRGGGQAPRPGKSQREALRNPPLTAREQMKTAAMGAMYKTPQQMEAERNMWEYQQRVAQQQQWGWQQQQWQYQQQQMQAQQSYGYAGALQMQQGGQYAPPPPQPPQFGHPAQQRQAGAPFGRPAQPAGGAPFAGVPFGQQAAGGYTAAGTPSPPPLFGVGASSASPPPLFPNGPPGAGGR
ncbi:hypothetical protein TeGR_g9001 [Tetraparma gracilis]|uniref:Uncharacterized protein n=1 Tax=Tetraparma gracilis TaxID=2962635 RepID=A0ABQ6MIH0_9STRA|nr:hypothetical protein TeGR_g9001 [Tetraparma gracilis]